MNLGLIPTLFFFFGLLSLVYAVVVHFYLRRNDPQVVDHWSLGSLLWGMSVTLTVFRSEVPLLLSYFGANALGFVANIELNRALKILSSQDRKFSVSRYLDGVYFLVYWGLLYAIATQAPVSWREIGKTGFVSAVMVMLSAWGARYCYQVARLHGLNLARNFGHLFLIVAVLWGSRIFIALSNQGVHAFDMTAFNTLVFVSIFITGIAKYLIFPILLLQKTENEKQEQLKKTLLRANKTVTSGALSASIAHELNQPLTAIRINGQMLRKTLDNKSVENLNLSADELGLLIEEILNDNERAAKIIGSLRAIFAQGEVSQSSVDSAQLVVKTVDRVKVELEKSLIKLDLQLSPKLPINVREDELQLVIMNLLFNSMQAMQGQRIDKVIAIHTELDHGMVRFAFSDNGPGIPKEMNDLLFNILTTSKDTGMGVGLWLCKYIIERHEGTITLAPSLLGGATFQIRLPLATSALT